jgi:hypothetical protein
MGIRLTPKGQNTGSGGDGSGTFFNEFGVQDYYNIAGDAGVVIIRYTV